MPSCEPNEEKLMTFTRVRIAAAVTIFVVFALAVKNVGAAPAATNAEVCAGPDVLVNAKLLLGHLTYKQKVCESSGDMVRTDYNNHANRWFSSEEAKVFRPQGSLKLADGSVVRIGDDVMFDEGPNSKQSILEIGSGMVRTDWNNRANVFFAASFFHPYVHADQIALADGTIVKVGDNIFFDDSGRVSRQRVLDIANGLILTDWNDNTNMYFETSRFKKAN